MDYYVSMCIDCVRDNAASTSDRNVKTCLPLHTLCMLVTAKMYQALPPLIVGVKSHVCNFGAREGERGVKANSDVLLVYNPR